jgi:hypothetical protein
MEPKNKAQELIHKFGKMAVFVVDEILNTGALNNSESENNQTCYNYWLDVRNEIE